VACGLLNCAIANDLHLDLEGYHTRQFVRPSVTCQLLNVNMPKHHCVDVPLNWRLPTAATVGSQQQAYSVSLCTLSGRGANV